MDGRKRTVQIKFRVTEAERDLILEKMKLIPTRNMAALRKHNIKYNQIDFFFIQKIQNMKSIILAMHSMVWYKKS